MGTGLPEAGDGHVSEETLPWRNRFSLAVLGFAPLLLIGLGWELISTLAPNPLLPPPNEWFAGLSEVGAPKLGAAVWATVLVFLAGLALATAAGAIAGVVIGYSAGLRRALAPLLEFLRAIPAPVIVPIAVLAWGTGLMTSLFSVALAASWPVLMNTIQATLARPRLQGDVARTLQLGSRRELTTIVLPATIPGILLGFRVAVPIALIVTVLVEMLTSSGGIGSLLLTAQRQYQSDLTFGLLLVAGAVGYLLTLGTGALTRQGMRRWPPEQR